MKGRSSYAQTDLGKLEKQNFLSFLPLLLCNALFVLEEIGKASRELKDGLPRAGERFALCRKKSDFSAMTPETRSGRNLLSKKDVLENL
jgi:hypothetical protein